jgi:hypothetical protein
MASRSKLNKKTKKIIKEIENDKETQSLIRKIKSFLNLRYIDLVVF